MPRIKRNDTYTPRLPKGNIAELLAAELKSANVSGQPMVDERVFSTGKMRVTVIWDKWDAMTFEDRTAIILRAYELAEGRDYRDRIALANGLTVPEAHAAGMLPFQIIAALRKGDPVTLEQVHRAMVEEGGSILLGVDKPQLRFATEEEAEAAIGRLSKRLPGSEPVWVVNQEVGSVEE